MSGSDLYLVIYSAPDMADGGRVDEWCKLFDVVDKYTMKQLPTLIFIDETVGHIAIYNLHNSGYLYY